MIEAKLGNTTQAVNEYTSAQSLLEELVDSRTRDDVPAAVAAGARAQQSRHPRRRPPRHRRSPRPLRAGDRDMQRRLVDRASRRITDYAAQLADSQSNLGMLLDAAGRRRDAPKLRSTKRCRLLRPLVAAADADPRYARNLSIAANNLSYVVAKRDPAAAERTMREAVESLERLSLRSRAATATRATSPCATTTSPRS